MHDYEIVNKRVAETMNCKQLKYDNCGGCKSGTDEYTRKDGQPLTEQDIKDLKPRGWMKGKAGDLSVKIDWSLDSSG